MAIRDILIFPDDRLRQETKDVSVFDDELQTLIDDMFETMYHADGIGLAAPQIGESRRVVVIDIADTDDDGNVLKHNPLVLINPKIVKSEGKCTYKEGCLSVPDCYEEVERAQQVVVEALDAQGNAQTIEADGLLAICIQHEIDHLYGHIFVDYLSTIKRNKINKRLKQYKKTKEQDQN